ncbi:MAG: aldo/keto reductase [Treponema sp.]|jgi:predicted aldo/keto reductase-like oxidoreductase|nr:aldo/keto reductase [Treponema sp.]
MQFRLDKQSGNKLSVLGFGCMRFPRNLGTIDMQKTSNLIIEAINKGVNYFDTAYMYPGSEEALGGILEKYKVRGKVYIATKLPLVLLRGPKDFDKLLAKQLERLRTSYIDYYLMHMITDTELWEKLRGWGIEDWIQEQKKNGRIKRIGFSFHGSQQEFLKLIDAYPWEFCQIQYNYSDENFQAGKVGLKKAAEKMAVMVMEPLLGGKLATGLPREAVDIFKKAHPGMSPVGWALRWIWDQREVCLLLSGMQEPRQLEENLQLATKAYPQMLTGEEHKIYLQVLQVFNKAYKIRCTGCNYCMPCPQGVNIPGCFAAYNTSFSMGFVSGMQQYMTSTGITSERMSGPRLCVKCGKCETHCPQGIPIIRSLVAVRKRMEPLVFWGIILLVRALLGKKGKKGISSPVTSSKSSSS